LAEHRPPGEADRRQEEPATLISHRRPACWLLRRTTMQPGSRSAARAGPGQAIRLWWARLWGCRLLSRRPRRASRVRPACLF